MQDYYLKFLQSDRYRESRAEKARVMHSVIGSELDSAALIADVGSGSGLLKRELEKITQRVIFGFELDAEALVERTRTCIADGTRLPLPDSSFDLLILNHVYEHVRDPRKLFGEAARIVKLGGIVYVTAGSRWALMEPHYRLPFLSWLPARVADWYVRCMRRGAGYRGIRFLGYRTLVRCMRVSGIRVVDITEDAIQRGLRSSNLRSSRSWQWGWKLLRRIPRPVRKRILRFSPQWFFLLERDAPPPRPQNRQRNQVPSRMERGGHETDAQSHCGRTGTRQRERGEGHRQRE